MTETKTHRTTIDLPESLYKTIRHLIADGKISNLRTAIIWGLMHVVKQNETKRQGG